VVRAYGITDKGRVRPTNEDSLVIDERLQLLVVADGMGGHNAGEVASRLAVDTIAEHVRRDLDGGFVAVWPFGFDESISIEANVLRTAVLIANMQILETAASSRDLSGMGTTIVAALVHHDRVSVAHVGDSRAYLCARTGMRLLTVDDSWMTSVLANDPHADPIALQHHPLRHALTNVVGAAARTDVHVVEEFLQGGERLVLTTDGVHGVLDERRIGELVGEGGNPDEIAAGLIDAALARGSRDNCTAVVAFYSAGLQS
jgi:PPM family protein phosphatase